MRKTLRLASTLWSRNQKIQSRFLRLWQDSLGQGGSSAQAARPSSRPQAVGSPGGQGERPRGCQHCSKICRNIIGERDDVNDHTCKQTRGPSRGGRVCRSCGRGSGWQLAVPNLKQLCLSSFKKAQLIYPKLDPPVYGWNLLIISLLWVHVTFKNDLSSSSVSIKILVFTLTFLLGSCLFLKKIGLARKTFSSGNKLLFITSWIWYCGRSNIFVILKGASLFTSYVISTFFEFRRTTRRLPVTSWHIKGQSHDL